jgi:hypothetical protein
MGITLAAGRAGEQPRRRRVVEIAGPAGAGKSTLLDALGHLSPSLRVVRRLWSPGYLARFTVCALGGTPLRVRRLGPAGLSWREMMIVAHLGALPHLVPRGGGGPRVTVFDQGPVFMLTRLYGAGVEEIADRRVRRWWAATLARWTAAVDAVIRLDAPDPVLVERIRSRAKWHVTKGQSELEAADFLRRSRRASEAIGSRLGLVPGPRLLEFDTSRLGVSEIAAALADELLGEPRSSRTPPSLTLPGHHGT